MSSGFGVGDFLALARLANRIRKDYADAPDQFRQINSEYVLALQPFHARIMTKFSDIIELHRVRNLAIALVDVDVSLGAHDVSDAQRDGLREIRDSCRTVLEDTSKELSKYSSLDTKTGSFQDRVRRVWKRMRWEPNDVRDLRSRITLNITTLNAFTGANTRDTIFKLEIRQDRQESQEIFEWLTPIDTTAQQTDFIRQRQAGTGQWLLDSPEYIKWKSTKSELLFCHGIPGAGKTILSSIVVNDLQESFENETDVAVCYFFCNFKCQEEQELENILLGFLKQLSQAAESIPGSVKALFSRCQSKRSRPSLEELVATIRSVCASFSRIFIVVDALDECRISDGFQREFISHLIKLRHIAGVNLLATSRPVPHIMHRLKEFESLEIRASTEDIRRFAEASMQDLPRFVGRHPELLNEIVDSIVKVVDGMFLLAKLHLDSLKGKTSPRELRKTLSNFTTGSNAYDEAYRSTLQRIQGQLIDQRELAMNTLMWIVHAKRPLRTVELQHALGVEVGELEFFQDSVPDLDDMVSACCGLVTVDNESHTIRLIHYTTQEFFDRQGCQYFPNAHAQISSTCVTYLSFDVFRSGRCPNHQEFRRRLANFPLFDYASKYWGHHAKHQPVSEPTRSLLSEPRLVQACSQALMIPMSTRVFKDETFTTLFPSGVTGLHLAAYFGLSGIMQCFLDDELDPDVQDSRNQTPLSWAAIYDQEVVLCALLDRGARVDHRNARQRTPLLLAAANGHEAIVQHLLDHGAQIDTKDNRGLTALTWAVGYGHEIVARLLLDHGAQVEIADWQGRTPLTHAAAGGHGSIVRLLLENRTRRFGSAYKPASKGHSRTKEMLLKNEAPIGSVRPDGHTLLTVAAMRGDGDIVALLLRNGADMNMTTNWGWSPLAIAAYYGHTRIVELLVDHGAATARVKNTITEGTHKVDVNLTTDLGRSPLSIASYYGHTRIEELLLERGAIVDTRYRGDSIKPLMLAAEHGYSEISRLLLAGSDYNLTDVLKRSALHHSVKGAHLEVVEILLAQDDGLDLNARDHWGSTAVSFAARFGHVDIFKRIVAWPNVDLSIGDSFGRTTLWWAVKQGHNDIARHIIELVQSQSSFTTDNQTPLPAFKRQRFEWGQIQCDVCWFSCFDSWYHCEECLESDFDICRECYELGARCLVQAHNLSVKTP